WPNSAGVIVMNSLRVGVADGIEPETGKVFGAGVAGEHIVHGFFVSAGRFVGQEAMKGLRRGRRTGETGSQAAKPARFIFGWIGFEAALSQLVGNETIDGIL